MSVLLTLSIYFCVLLIYSRVVSRGGGNDAFYRGNRRSPWYMVAFGMVGASISGVTFVSVPGMVNVSGMAYMQTCLGFVLGYVVVAFVLLPVYYRYRLTTIYSFLRRRLGERSYKTGASFFLLSKMTGAAVRFYIVCIILLGLCTDNTENTAFTEHLLFPLIVVGMVSLIWLYTRRGGIKTLVWTDTLQTVCMFAALLLIICHAAEALGMGVGEAFRAVEADSRSRIFVFDDWMDRQYFWKQFVSGIFIVIVMTGLDQDMMQKNLTCKTLRDAQKDVCTYGLAFVPANFLFLALGIMLSLLAERQGLPLPQAGDELLPMFAATGRMGNTVVVMFTLGIVAASFSSADSALTSLTTSYCVDIRQRPDDERLRRRVHIGMACVFALFILLFRLVNSTSVIDAIYVMCSYTYGPLLGLFAFGLLTKRETDDRLVPYIAIGSPVVCFVIDKVTNSLFCYHFGYELLMLNGLLTFIGLYLAKRK